MDGGLYRIVNSDALRVQDTRHSLKQPSLFSFKHFRPTHFLGLRFSTVLQDNQELTESWGPGLDIPFCCQ